MQKYLTTPGRTYSDSNFDFMKFLAGERNKHDTADRLRLDHCNMCGFCCLRMPCGFAPDEVQNVAIHLGVPVDELISNYLVIRLNEANIPYLNFARETQADLLGKPVPYSRIGDRGYCIMFDRNTHKCRVHGLVLRETKRGQCWKEHDFPVPGVASLWRRGDIFKFIPDYIE